MTLLTGPRESLAAALQRAGVPAPQARAVSGALADEVDVVNPRAGRRLELAITAEGRVEGATLWPGPGSRLDLAAGPGGAWSLRRTDVSAAEQRQQISGVVAGSLFLSLVQAGAAPDTAERVAQAFAGRLDLTRQVNSGDGFRLILRRSGPSPAEVVLAEITGGEGRTRLYGLGGQLIEADGTPQQARLLRTPLAAARVTSGFGLRLHPLLGVVRFHEGEDFAAPAGAPVLAAADGVVAEARWASGYGRWLRLDHGAGLGSGYGHLSAWAGGVAPGVRVRQGQVVGFVGSSGLATGPHLHFEVFENGRRIDPAHAPLLAAAAPAAGFTDRRAEIDALASAMSAMCGPVAGVCAD